MGSGLGSVPLPRLLAAIAGVLDGAAKAELTLPISLAPLTDVQSAWARDDGGRTAFTIA